MNRHTFFSYWYWRVIVMALFAASLACVNNRPAKAQDNPTGQTPSTPATLQTPSAHPRLWWTEERLARARQGVRSLQIRDDDYLGQAFLYAVTKDPKYARGPVRAAVGMTLPDVSPDRVSSDHARWYGEGFILIFDWCWDQFSADERRMLIDRWNGYFEMLSKKDWGGVTMPQNNYFWGYLRNELEWGIATAGENPLAATFIDNALRRRWTESFVPHTRGAGLGGVPQEGSQYGPYLLSYPVVPFVTASNLGRNLFAETDFFKSALLYLIYTTTPAPTALRGTDKRAYEVFPSNDDEVFRDGGSAENESYGNFMATAMDVWRDTPLSEYARKWMNMTGAKTSSYVAALDQGGTERDFTDLPLDYYAPGPQVLLARNAWGSAATLLHLQLGALTGVGHSHDDLGNWQLWRNGRWLSRETTGYAENLADYAGRGQADTGASAFHNLLLVNGKGFAAGERNGPPVVRRLESRPDYTYATVDLTNSYRNTNVQWRRVERDNAAAEHVEREFVFVRGLETLVIFDRVQSGNSAMPAESVTKTFLAHFEQKPQIQDANHILVVNGDQALRLTTLVPVNPTYRVVEEGGRVGQFRLEAETSGAAQSYFLHVLQGRDANGADIEASVSETNDQFIVQLRDGTRGGARLVFQKGSQSTGGGFAFSAGGPPESVTPFLDRIQGITVTDAGPVWENSSGGDAPAARTPSRRKTNTYRGARRR